MLCYCHFSLLSKSMLKKLRYLKAASLMPYSTFECAHLTVTAIPWYPLISSNFQHITIFKLSFLIHIKYLEPWYTCFLKTFTHILQCYSATKTIYLIYTVTWMNHKNVYIKWNKLIQKATNTWLYLYDINEQNYRYKNQMNGWMSGTGVEEKRTTTRELQGNFLTW